MGDAKIQDIEAKDVENLDLGLGFALDKGALVHRDQTVVTFDAAKISNTLIHHLANSLTYHSWGQTSNDIHSGRDFEVNGRRIRLEFNISARNQDGKPLIFKVANNVWRKQKKVATGELEVFEDDRDGRLLDAIERVQQNIAYVARCLRIGEPIDTDQLDVPDDDVLNPLVLVRQKDGLLVEQAFAPG